MHKHYGGNKGKVTRTQPLRATRLYMSSVGSHVKFSCMMEKVNIWSKIYLIRTQGPTSYDVVLEFSFNSKCDWCNLAIQ